MCFEQRPCLHFEALWNQPESFCQSVVSESFTVCSNKTTPRPSPCLICRTNLGQSFGDLGSAGHGRWDSMFLGQDEFFRYITTKRLINNTYPSDVYRVRRCEISTDATLRSVQLLTLRCNPTKDSGALVTFLLARLARKISRARSAIVVQNIALAMRLRHIQRGLQRIKAMFCNANPKRKIASSQPDRSASRHSPETGDRNDSLVRNACPRMSLLRTGAVMEQSLQYATGHFVFQLPFLLHEFSL